MRLLKHITFFVHKSLRYSNLHKFRLLPLEIQLEFLSRFIYLFGVLRHFQHCTGHITMGSWKGRGNPYIQFVRVLYCKLLTNGKQLPALSLEAVPGIEPRPQRWEVRVLQLCHHGPQFLSRRNNQISYSFDEFFPLKFTNYLKLVINQKYMYFWTYICHCV